MKAKWKKKLTRRLKSKHQKIRRDRSRTLFRNSQRSSYAYENEDPINNYSCRWWSIDWDDIEIFEDGSPDHSSEALIHTAAETNGVAGDGRANNGRIGFGFQFDGYAVGYNWVGYLSVGIDHLSFLCRLLLKATLPYMIHKIPRSKGSSFWLVAIQVIASLNLLLSIVVSTFHFLYMVLMLQTLI
uniref:Uncharacterized protein n=1 Tax=Solanum lycopersicum TaxID=4081 RepID=A0A3Q7GHR0_SOLLC